jgi:hypothetical protein
LSRTSFAVSICSASRTDSLPAEDSTEFGRVTPETMHRFLPISLIISVSRAHR